MIRPRLLVALPFCLGVAVHGFSVGTSSVAFRPNINKFTSTCLFAEDAKAKTATNADDILSSPAFLNRKLEVLKSDLAKAEDELAAAQTSLEQGKADWGKQLDDLEKEVRCRESTCGVMKHAVELESNTCSYPYKRIHATVFHYARSIQDKEFSGNC